MPFSEAKIGVMTHALNYGTGVFEGIRAYWNEGQDQLYLLKMREHYERLQQSCRIMRMELPHTIDELCEITRQLAEMNGYRQDIYIRPLAFQDEETITPRLHDVSDAFALYMVPMGNYIDVEAGIRVAVSSWRRMDDNMIPPRAKVTGLYVNSALAKTEALENGFDEAIMLTQAGYVSEGSAENIFLLIDNTLVTPSSSQNILMGITRASVIEIAREELGIETVERPVGRSELYVADEVMLTGTGAQISPVIEIDRRLVGSGDVGPITARLQHIYFDAVRGDHPKYTSWSVPVYKDDAPPL